jgi:hypothetical protein
MGMTSFREVLEKMLVIVVLPVRKSLRKEVELFSPHLVSNTCGLLASIVSELTASALGSEVTLDCVCVCVCVSHMLNPSVLCSGKLVSFMINLRYHIRSGPQLNSTTQSPICPLPCWSMM